ncbi:uncharacterized protein ACLA_091560 [Aspergillus clavatus NRRL 1]|uniref:Uncharacterized protein n=1 Tax=Aspergillus clavatus (strain ATCC 1007 / CBS 513.65 / DSM 816 / NCTC 3887 / NRRL 1 / QM 1276 / 107) TaxID=344612 RepID=A1CF09_ASPCL|nr:uncharacterized protein ACLA_091560 [Aspergillus clavatus NRRL 1]EAW11458.1 hypothetical protein ACLA_091560 [Aspergillus clavatus NRRL 1]
MNCNSLKNQRLQHTKGKFKPSLGCVCSLDEALETHEAWEIKKREKDEKSKAVEA